MQPTLFGLLVCVCGLFSSGSSALTWQVVLCLFGGAAAIAMPALGGATITPPVLFLPFLVWRAHRESRHTQFLQRVPREGVYLAGAALWGILCAFIVPRLFTGKLEILTVDRSAEASTTAVLMPLQPVSGNITQSAYAVGSVAAFLACRQLLNRPSRLEQFKRAVLWLTALNGLAAGLNLAHYYLGLPDLLQYVRTASYAQFTAYEAHGTGLVRITGTFPETSAFALFTLPLFAFTSTLWYLGRERRKTGLWAAVSFVLLLLSTSTTAYVGLALYVGAAAAFLLWRLYEARRLPYLRMLSTLLSIVLLLVLAAFVFETALARRAVKIIDVMVLSKLESDSGLERGLWNAQAWSNFLDTFGVGVGIGSARASSYLLVLLSNTGLIGTLCFFGFLFRVFTMNRNRAYGHIQLASRNAVFAAFIGACLSAAVFDLGLLFFALAAAATTTAHLTKDAPSEAQAPSFS